MVQTTQIIEYATQVLTVQLGAAGKQAIITFIPHGGPPVLVYVPRTTLERFLDQASSALIESPLDGSV